MSGKALATFATGRHEELLAVSRPGFVAYALRHGYAYVEGMALGRGLPPHPERSPSWQKVPLLYELLGTFDAVLWLDCDVVIMDGSVDVADLVRPDQIQAMVRHHTPDGEVPNCGVWLLRRRMRGPLRAMWDMGEYADHPWWEQAAMLDLLGYRHLQRPCMLEAPTNLYRDTEWLPLAWNSHEQNDRHPTPIFAHVTPNTVDWRLPIMRRYAEMARVPA